MGSGWRRRLWSVGDFNVTALADPNGAVIERYAYDAYGKPQFFAADDGEG